MVIVQLLGGLGNQMFQYAFGRSLALKNNSTLKVDTQILLDHRPGVHDVNRNYDLDIFKLEVSKASIAETWKYHSHAMNWMMKSIHVVNKALVGNNVYSEPYFQFSEEASRLTGNIYLKGLWQSYRYFDDYADIIKQDFVFSNPLDANASALAKSIRNERSVCLNVRRTDYVNNKNTADILSFVGLEYYENAVACLNERISGLSYYIFSDDIEWCKTHFDFIKSDKVFVDYNYAGPKFSFYLQLMIACQYFIIPNSTFAWWAAWLSDSPDKIVIIPKKWFNDAEVIVDDLIPNSWMRL